MKRMCKHSGELWLAGNDMFILLLHHDLAEQSCSDDGIHACLISESDEEPYLTSVTRDVLVRLAEQVGESAT